MSNYLIIRLIVQQVYASTVNTQLGVGGSGESEGGEAGFVLPPPRSSDVFTSSSSPPPTPLGYHTGFVLPPPTSPEPNQSDDFLRSSNSPPLTLASMPEQHLTPVVSRARKVARLVSWLAYF